MPGQNTPATTTQATIEQGMKVFTAIYKRTFRALSKEFKKVFRLNSLYTENFQGTTILTSPLGLKTMTVRNMTYVLVPILQR
jgi:hypothetical protein